MVDTVSSAARIPFPEATRACAVSSRLYFVTSTSCSSHEWSVPDLHRGRVVVVAEDVQGRGVEREVLAAGGRKADPPRDQHSEDVAVGEQGDVARRVADAGDDAIDPRAELRGCLATRAAVPEDHPARLLLADLLRREPLLLAVVPFLQVGLDHRASAETRQLARLARSTERTG